MDQDTKEKALVVQRDPLGLPNPSTEMAPKRREKAEARTQANRFAVRRPVLVRHAFAAEQSAPFDALETHIVPGCGETHFACVK